MVSLGWSALVLLGAIVWFPPQEPSPQEPEPALSWHQVEGRSLTLKRGDEVVWTFHYGDDRAKPCFHPLALPGGRVLTVDQPKDHPWHHGLWFSWKYIDGVNYWENDGKTGRPVGRTTWKVTKLETNEDGGAQIELDVSYAPPDGEAVLTEKRDIAVGAPRKDGGILILWDATFTARAACELDRTPLPGEKGGQPFGGYAGLSLRMAQLEERDAVTSKGPVEWNAQSRFRGEASAFDYRGRLVGQDVGIAVVDYADNPRSPTSWYAIRSSNMTFFSPAVLCREPLALNKGETFRLRYLVMTHRGHLDEGSLRRLASCCPSSGR